MAGDWFESSQFLRTNNVVVESLDTFIHGSTTSVRSLSEIQEIHS
jgi:hypothetical protein